MALSVRRATPEDAAGVAAVHVGSWQETYRGAFPDQMLDGLSVEKRTRFWSGKLAEPATWVACDAHDVVGFLNVGPSRGEDVPGAQEIYCLYAMRSHHDRGVGRDLLGACLAFLRNGVVILWVLERNERARRFYEQAGFEPDGTTKPAGLFGCELPKMRYRKELHG